MSVPSWARKGARVVCVDAGDRWETPSAVSNPNGRLVQGGVYVVARAYLDHAGIAVVRVRGLWRGLRCIRGKWVWNPGWLLSRFRPVIEPKTEAEDREFFRHWLKAPHSIATTPAPVEGADA